MPYRLYRGLLALVFRTLWRPVIEGASNIPAEGPVLIAANHVSFIDAFLIAMANQRIFP